MRKQFLIAVMILTFTTTNALAGFNFGEDTYEQVDNVLIVNSLGDQVAESQFESEGVSLGYNDYIPENAFKNNLYNEGYTKVYDSIPNGVDVVEVGYMGKLGDPRSYDADYVLKSEWEKYSSQYQDVRIDENKSNITQNTADIQTNKTNIKWNTENIQENSTQISTNSNNIKKNSHKIVDNTKKITTNTNNITKVNKRVTNVDNRHTTWNNQQDTAISNNRTDINNNTTKIYDLDGRMGDVEQRVENLERTQTIIGANVRVYDSRKWSVETFADYSTIRNTVDRVGVRVTFKAGRSYEEKRLDELEEKLQMLSDQAPTGIMYLKGTTMGIKQAF